MALPAGEGISVLYAMADEWMWRRDVLTLLGAKDPGRLDTLLEEASIPRPLSRQRRADQIAAAGGEIA